MISTHPPVPSLQSAPGLMTAAYRQSSEQGMPEVDPKAGMVTEVDPKAGLLEVDPKAGSRSDKPMIVPWPCLQDFGVEVDFLEQEILKM